MKTSRHPYELRLRIREKLPWFLINLGIAQKGKDCEAIDAEHVWYNLDDNYAACYYCRVKRQGKLWEKESGNSPSV